MNNNNFNIVGLDFNEVKDSLKQYLRGQDTLKDYNFDGSVLNTILDVLAYNTHYQSFYANMVANEMFLDTAIMRPSVSSHVKSIGYVPRSTRAASVSLDLFVNTSNNTTIQRGSTITGVDSAGTRYSFVGVDAVLQSSPGYFKKVLYYQGTLRRISYIYDSTKNDSTYLLIPNDKVDTRTIRVSVSSSVTDTTGSSDVWTQANSYISAKKDSNIFFIEEKDVGLYAVYFGDNFLGKKPNNGNLITIEYVETDGDEGNGISRFTSTAFTDIKVLYGSSSGGSKPETIKDIKFIAPKYYQSGGRSVTESDYVASVLREYPNANSVRVYGGETVSPPQYGKIFIAIKPTSGSALTSSEKDVLKKSLQKNSSIVSIIPEIVDPEYTDIVVSSIVTYDPEQLSTSAGGLQTLIYLYLFTYSLSTLESFGKNLYLSKITEDITNIDKSILANQTKISLRKTRDVGKFSISKGFVLDFKNPIKQNNEINVISNRFRHLDKRGVLFADCVIEDDGVGSINVVKNTVSTGSKVTVFAKVGTVNYQSGVVAFNSKFSPFGISTGPYFVVTVVPKNNDIFAFENGVLRISRVYTDSVKIDMVAYEDRKKNLNI